MRFLRVGGSLLSLIFLSTPLSEAFKVSSVSSILKRFSSLIHETKILGNMLGGSVRIAITW